MNKKHIFIVITSIVLYTPIHTQLYSSFFRARPISQMSELEYGLTQWYLYNAQSSRPASRFYFEATPFYFHSINPKKLGTYFSPDNKKELAVNEYNIGDINSLWFGVMAQPYGSYYAAQLKIRPVRDIVGSALKVIINLDPEFCHTWISVYMPIGYASFKSGISETTFGNHGGTPGFNSIMETLDKKFYGYSNISQTARKKVLCDDMLIRLGYDFIDECDRLTPYGLIYVPTSRGSDGVYMIEAAMGNGGHPGIGFGLNADGHLWQKECRSIRLLGDARFAYFFARHEIRTPDLKNSNWSRYFTVDYQTKLNDPTRQPLTDFITGNYTIKPGMMFDLWLAAHYNRNNLNIEAGYNLWWHQKERIGRGEAFQTFPYNLSIIVPQINIPFHTASNATIANGNSQGPNALALDDEPQIIHLADIDQKSATQKATGSSTLYYAMSHDFIDCAYEGMIGGGVSVEIAHNRAALSQLGLWLKAGIALS